MNKIKNINMCPNCQKSDYYIFNDSGLIAGQTGIYVCNNCGFKGIFPQIDLDEISKLKKVNKPNILKKVNKSDIPKNIESKKDKLNKLNLIKLFIILLLVFLIYTAYRFGLFDFVQSQHEHAIDFFPRYGHLK